MPRRPTKETPHGEGELEQDLERENAKEEQGQEGKEQAAQEEEVGAARFDPPSPMGFLSRFRHSRILKNKLLDEEAWKDILGQHPIFDRLSAEEKGRLRELATLFLHEKSFEGADGLTLTGFMREVISAQACLPILNLGLEWYNNWKTVIVVPDVFVAEHTEYDAAGVAHEWDEDKSGESWDSGPVILSWKDVEASGWGDGYNVIIHEAVHRLDLLDGEVNGRPALHKGMSATEWLEIFSRAYEDLSRRTQGKKKSRIRIDEYAAESDSEFFAVTSEHFFEQPRILRSEYPDVYRLLADFYRQQPAQARSLAR
jgi:Mlc titration factor MtfA (ptsG expression regulator)